MSPEASARNFDAEYDLRAAFPDYEKYFADWRFRSQKAREQLPACSTFPTATGLASESTFSERRLKHPCSFLSIGILALS